MLTKEQEKKTKLQKQLSEEKTSNLSEKESRVMIVKKMIQDLRNRMEEWIKKIKETFSKDLEQQKNKQRWTRK